VGPSARPRHRSDRVGSIVVTAILAAVLASCSGGGSESSASKSSSTSSTTTTSTTSSSGASGADHAWKGPAVSPTAIPLGDGNVSTTPEIDFVDSCTTTFNGRGASGDGPWIDAAARTWNSETKPAVSGSVSWPDATNSFTVEGSNRVLSTNDLPKGQTTGTFPISTSDPAYQYDRNPNSISAQSANWTVPAVPTAAASPSCTGLGPIGVTLDGVYLFNALDALGNDAGAHELQDSCEGHPEADGAYHYHTLSPCLLTDASRAPSSSTLVAYALDGYGVFVERDANGDLPTNADLDACHGRTSTVTWDGEQRSMYHYDATLEYPYTVGCYHGTPVTSGPGR
jgi:YHYH protein